MQCTSKTYPTSFVVTDPKGSILIECGKMLQKFGYRIRFLNTINMKKSMHYNPFAYIHSEKDILKLVTTLIANTKGEGKGGDDFWVKAETLLFTALIGYIHYEAPTEEQNFSTLLEMINAMEVREDDEEFENPVDLMFKELESRQPGHFAVRQYKKYKLAAGKTAKSILISAAARTSIFDIQEVRDLTAYDELELDTLGDRKTALFLIMSDTEDSMNFLIAMAYSQLFNLLCEKADDVYGGRLPVHVRCLIDEAANIGQIPRLEKLVATIRSREVSACLVLQAQSQLKAIYKDNADTIIGNMDATVFLGGKEPTTLKELAASLGKETIDTYNTGESRGRETSHSLNYQKLGKDLPAETPTISHEQYLALNELLKKKHNPALLPIQIAYFAGLRIGEVCGLTWQDIDLKEQCLTIRRSMRYDSVRKKTQIGPTKRKKIRTVDFCDTLAAILREAKKEQMLNSIKYGPLYSKNYYRIVKEKNRTYYEVYSLPRTETPPEGYTQVSFVCLRSDGAYEAPATVSSVCRYSRKKIGDMDDFHFHLLRHTYTTNLLSHGAAPKDVQELLGHSDVSTTMNIYAHATREAKRTSARLLDKVVGTA